MVRPCLEMTRASSNCTQLVHPGMIFMSVAAYSKLLLGGEDDMCSILT